MTLLDEAIRNSTGSSSSSEETPGESSEEDGPIDLLSTVVTKLCFGCVDESRVTKKKLITVCMHGDETCGMKATNELIKEGFFLKELQNTTTRVTIVVANPRGAEANKRFIDVNLNRIFHEDRLRRKGVEPPSPIENDPLFTTAYEVGLVQKLANEIEECDEYIDIHSTSAGSLPFALPAADPESEKLATSFAVDFVIQKLVKSVQGTSIGWAQILKKKAICFECGQHTDVKTIEVAKRVIKRFVTDRIEETAKNVLQCESNQVIRKGFHFVRTPPVAFERVSCNEVLAEDDEVGKIKCTASAGAYIIMPTANPILGEEAWFWGEVLEMKKEEKVEKVEKEM